MDRRPNTPYQPYRPSTPYCQHTQPHQQSWPPSRSTSPLSIPSPRLRPLTPTVYTEWAKLRSASQLYPTRPLQFRSHTPPSLSPSPAPSSASYYYDSDIEIEELSESPSDDSGIELLIGEYEEAPENYGKVVYDSEEEEVKEGQRNILFGLERLSAGTKKQGKRSYGESSGEESESSWGCDSGVSSVDEEWGRRVRRRVVRKPAEDCVSVCSFDVGSSNSSDNEIDMEL